MNWRFWTWGRKRRLGNQLIDAYRLAREHGDNAFLMSPPCPTFYCENCQSNEPHGMICDAIYGERKKCVRCFIVTPISSSAQKLFSDANLRPDIGFDEARIKLENATRVYNEWAVKYALWRESDACVPALVAMSMPTFGDNGRLRTHFMTVNRKRLEDEPQYTD